MSLPRHTAEGIWPAFWLMPESDVCWPTGGEIDVMEYNGNQFVDRVFGSFHWAPNGTQYCGKDREPLPGHSFKPSGAEMDWQTAWHVYGVRWTGSNLTFSCDGVDYYSVGRTTVDLPVSPMYLILNQAVDPLLFPPSPGSGSYPAILEVEWVRVWQL